MSFRTNLVAGVLLCTWITLIVQAQIETFQPPLGLPALPVPADNPMTIEKVELGKMLYFDKRLSKDNTVSCATCHMPDHAYAEPRSTSEGIRGQVGDMNSPTVINSSYHTSMFWDGRMKSLEEQAGGPIENPIEMGHNIAALAAELNKIPVYKKLFQDAFGAPASKETITKAIASFERTILSGNSSYDQYMNGDTSAMTREQVKGMELFRGKALCATCHTPPLFTNGNFVNTGIGQLGKGRNAVTGVDSDHGAYRVPALREVKNTSPYFHDGSVKTLEEAASLMGQGGVENPNRHPILRVAPKLTQDEVVQLIAFLNALSGEFPVVDEPKLP